MRACVRAWVSVCVCVVMSAMDDARYMLHEICLYFIWSETVGQLNACALSGLILCQRGVS